MGQVGPVGQVGLMGGANGRHVLLMENTGEVKVERRWKIIILEQSGVNETLTLGFIPDDQGSHH